MNKQELINQIERANSISELCYKVISDMEKESDKQDGIIHEAKQNYMRSNFPNWKENVKVELWNEIIGFVKHVYLVHPTINDNGELSGSFAESEDSALYKPLAEGWFVKEIKEVEG